MDLLDNLDSTQEPYPREETPCRIEPLFRLPQLSSLASRVFRLTPWPIEVDTVEAAIVEASIVEASIVEASIVEVSIVAASIVAAMCAVAFTACPHADITLTRPAINC